MSYEEYEQQLAELRFFNRVMDVITWLLVIASLIFLWLMLHELRTPKVTTINIPPQNITVEIPPQNITIQLQPKEQP